MKVTLKKDKQGNIQVWLGEPINTDDHTCDLYLQSYRDIKAITEEISEQVMRELNSGWTVYGVDIDDMWIGV